MVSNLSLTGWLLFVIATGCTATTYVPNGFDIWIRDAVAPLDREPATRFTAEVLTRSPSPGTRINQANNPDTIGMSPQEIGDFINYMYRENGFRGQGHMPTIGGDSDYSTFDTSYANFPEYGVDGVLAIHNQYSFVSISWIWVNQPGGNGQKDALFFVVKCRSEEPDSSCDAEGRGTIPVAEFGQDVFRDILH